MRTIFLIGAAAAGLLLASCADEGYYGGAGYGYSYASPDDVWYDGFYGPYADGYWGNDGVFFYRDRNGGFHRDDGGHFRHEGFEGAQHFHASPRPRAH